MEKNIAALILFYEKPDQTIECLKSLLPFGIPIYILNNGSSPRSTKIVEQFSTQYKLIHLIHSPTNLGVAAGRNKLIKATTQEWMLFLDNDIMAITPDMLNNLKNFIKKNPDADIIAGKLYNIHYKNWQEYSHIQENQEGSIRKRLKRFPGGVTFMNRRIFTAVGLYNEDMFIGLEDFEFASRAEKQAYSIVALQADDIRFVHDHRYMHTHEDRKATEFRYSLSVNSRSKDVAEHAGYTVSNEELERWLNEQKETMLGSPPDYGENISPTQCVLQAPSPLLEEIVHVLIAQYPKLVNFEVHLDNTPFCACEFEKLMNIFHNAEKRVRLLVDFSRCAYLASIPLQIEQLCLDITQFTKTNNNTVNKHLLEYFETLKTRTNAGFLYAINERNLQNLKNIIDFCDMVQPAFLMLKTQNWDNLSHSAKKIFSRNTKIKNEISNFIHKKNYPVSIPIFPDCRNIEYACKSYSHVITVTKNGEVGGCPRLLPRETTDNLLINHDSFNTLEMKRLRHNQLLCMPAHPECIYCNNNWDWTAE
jgi:GT2 family glycosyltransferase